MDDLNLTSEASFAEQLSIPREVVRELRQRALSSPTHFVKKGAAVWLTASGVDMLLAALGEKKSPLPPPAAPVALIVLQQVQNPRVVLARREDAPPGAAALVLAVPTHREGGRETNHFTPGLRVAARHRDGARYDYAGPRPRFRGDPLMLMLSA